MTNYALFYFSAVCAAFCALCVIAISVIFTKLQEHFKEVLQAIEKED